MILLFFVKIYSSDHHARMSVDMISSLIFINRKSRVTQQEKYIGLFDGSTENIQYQIYDTESSVEFFNE